MKAYNPFLEQLHLLIKQVGASTPSDEFSEVLEQVLNGQASKELRNLVNLDDLKRSGAFFTDSTLAERLIEPIKEVLQLGCTVLDPACGAGELLLACARHLPVRHDLRSTLDYWGHWLRGYDIHKEFVDACKLRLVLLAMSRGATMEGTAPNIEHLFPHISIRDALGSDEWLEADCCVLNPPYSTIQTPEEYHWTSGKISQAALFLLRALSSTTHQRKILAILPDVLRTGTRYQKWRRQVKRQTKLSSMQIFGKFDALTDVDVFIVEFLVSGTGANVEVESAWWSTTEDSSDGKRTVQERFKVRVGPVVPHRDSHSGQPCAYLEARLAPPWESIRIDEDAQGRRYAGTTYKPPFVVVRRTSSPSEKYRATATMVLGHRHVAVENHLIILLPKNETVAECIELVKRLKHSKTNDWLNERIRCRHLTVSALRDLPWWEMA